MKQLILIAALLPLATGCQKQNNPQADISKVEIVINSPASNQAFHRGDTVYIRASVSYNGQLHGCEVSIIDTASGLVLYSDAQHLHADKFEINNKWQNDLHSPTALKLSVIAYIDHSGNEARQERTIYVTP